MLSPVAIYRPGEQDTVDWTGQPMGSGVEQEHDAGQACPVCRSDDTLSVVVFPHVDEHDNLMLADAATTEQLTLFQNGVDVGQAPDGFATFPLSADPASYRLQYDVDTTAPWFPTSTHVSTSWGFMSEERPPDKLPPGWTCGGKLDRDSGCSFEHVLLPHYTTSAGLDGVIPAGTVAHVTVRVTPQRGLAADALSTFAGRVSFDGGTHWRAVKAVRKSDTAYRPELPAAGAGTDRRLRLAPHPCGGGVGQHREPDDDPRLPRWRPSRRSPHSRRSPRAPRRARLRRRPARLRGSRFSRR